MVLSAVAALGTVASVASERRRKIFTAFVAGRVSAALVGGVAELLAIVAANNFDVSFWLE